MATITITVPDSVYEWLARKADGSNRSVQSVLEDEVARLPESGAVDPDFEEALQGSLVRNKAALKRLAQ